VPLGDASVRAPDGAPRPADASSPGDATEPTAARANLRFKGGQRLRADYAQVLGLTPDQVCTELGRFDCVDDVHTVALGGVNPYVRGLYEPQPNTTVTTPLAVERMALSACNAAVDRDLAGDAEVFVDLEPAGIDPGGEALGNIVVTLYRRTVLRDPTFEELGHLRQLHRDIAAHGAERPGRAWGVLACFAVLTTMEALFY